MTDPRKAKSLGEAALNPDGTYNGIRALSWLSGHPRPTRLTPCRASFCPPVATTLPGKLSAVARSEARSNPYC